MKRSEDQANLDEFRAEVFLRLWGPLKLFVLLGAVLWLAGMVLCDLLFPHLAFNVRNALLIGIALPVAFFVAVVRFCLSYHTVRLDEETLELVRPVGVTVLHTEDVQGLVGLGGVRPLSQELIVWDRMVIQSEGRFYTVRLGEEASNELAYRALRRVCPHAWGVPFKEDPEPPLIQALTVDRESARLPVAELRGYFLRQAILSLLFGVVVFLVGCVLLLLKFERVVRAGESAQGWVGLAVLIAAGVLLVANASFQLDTLWKLGRPSRRRRRRALD